MRTGWWVCVAVAGCGAPPSTMSPTGRAPDVVVASQPTHGTLRMAVVRPTTWVAADGTQVRDSRITLAVEHVETAAWPMAARLTTEQGLHLAHGIEQLLEGRSLEAAGIDCWRSTPNLRAAIDTGAWRLDPEDGHVDLSLVDAANGKVIGRVRVGEAVAADMAARLRRVAWMRP